jgi:hypothetical protein
VITAVVVISAIFGAAFFLCGLYYVGVFDEKGNDE